VGFVLHTAFVGRTQPLPENKNPKHKKGPAENHGSPFVPQMFIPKKAISGISLHC
jgi:hypothetical protein